jgi:NADH:ubiquinone oxidoreductase subunit E
MRTTSGANCIQGWWAAADKRKVADQRVEYVFVCTGPTCGERGGREILAAWKALLVERREWSRRKAVPVKCFDQCALGPNVCSNGKFVSGAVAPSPAAAAELLDSLSGVGLPD